MVVAMTTMAGKAFNAFYHMVVVLVVAVLGGCRGCRRSIERQPDSPTTMTILKNTLIGVVEFASFLVSLYLRARTEYAL